jgi:hypothetical protein
MMLDRVAHAAPREGMSRARQAAQRAAVACEAPEDAHAGTGVLGEDRREGRVGTQRDQRPGRRLRYGASATSPARPISAEVHAPFPTHCRRFAPVAPDLPPTRETPPDHPRTSTGRRPRQTLVSRHS